MNRGIITSPGASTATSLLSRGQTAVVPMILSREHLFAGRRLDLGDVSGEIPGVGPNAGVAINHALIPHQKFVSEKCNRISALVLVQKS